MTILHNSPYERFDFDTLSNFSSCYLFNATVVRKQINKGEKMQPLKKSFFGKNKMIN